jgi:hypothetical protein
VLRRCHDSVAAQTLACTHILVADGHPDAQAAQWDVEHVTLPKSHGDNGNTPRCIGAISALNLGFEGVAFLDADNWYAPGHVESLVRTHRETGAAVTLADRHIVLPDGQVLAPENQEDTERRHADTSCFFFTAKAAALIPVWAMMDKPLSPICDRVMFHAMRARGVAFAWTKQRTVFFESRYDVHYRQAGLEPPPDAHFVDFKTMKALFSNQRNTERLGYDLGISIA